MGATGTVMYGAGTPYETEVTITATAGTGGVVFTAEVTKGVADLRGLFFDVGGTEIPSDSHTVGKKTTKVPYADKTSPFSWARGLVDGNEVTQTQWGEGLVNDLGNGANVKGGFDNPVTSPLEDGRYDFGVEFGTQGIGADDIRSATFFLAGTTIEEIINQAFAVRLTSTDDPTIPGADREGSLKLTGIFDPPGEEIIGGSGYSPGYWKTHGPLPNPGEQADDWNLPDNTQFAAYFGIPSLPGYDWLSGLSFDAALDLRGGGAYALARQATAAALNSVEEHDSVFNGYAFTQQEVIDWTQAAFTGNIAVIDTNHDGHQDWQTQSEAITGLKDVFASYNTI